MTNIKRSDLRNIAIIAHVDHGKTTLVDGMLRQSGTFRKNQEVAERVMDSGDLERERGITILAKNTSIHWKDTQINIVDTPGHADFGGEVERVLQMVSGVLLVVDAYEGPMPQTRFVLQKALELNLALMIVINKIDRPDARPAEVLDDVWMLLMELGCSDDQLDSPVVYVSARDGYASLTPDEHGDTLEPLLDSIVEWMPAPEGDPEAPLQMLISTIDYSDYLGRIGIGRVNRGQVKVGDTVVLANYNSEDGSVGIPQKVTALYRFEGLRRVPVTEASMGDIVALSGIENLEIGDTLCPPDAVETLPFVKISPPTVVMTFMVNDSPLAGREGEYVTSRHLRTRLFREQETDVSLKVEDTDRTDAFKVYGRGELHLSILIETMRRQGYEFAVSKPDVLLRQGPDGLEEPMERLVVDVPEEYLGAVVDKLSRRKGEMVAMNGREGRVRAEFIIPSRGLFGYRSDLMTDTHGQGNMTSVFEGYAPMKGAISSRAMGSLVASHDGETTPYALHLVQSRGTLFVNPNTQVYAGMVVGQCNRPEDIEINVCKKKQLTNMRSAAKDENVILSPAWVPTLEQAIEYIDDDELLEVTPRSLRIRKKILDYTQRYRARLAEQQRREAMDKKNG